MKTIDEILKPLPKIFLITMFLILAAHTVLQVLKIGYGYGRVYGLTNLFDLNLEVNLPSFYSTIILFNASLLLFMVYRVVNKTKPDQFWLFLSAVFLFLSMDEMVSLHETLTAPLRELLGVVSWFYFAWVTAGLLFVLVTGLISIPFLRRLPKQTARYFLFAAALYIVGSIGMEMINGRVAYGFVLEGKPFADDALYVLLVTIEEVLEMVGIILFNYALIEHLRNIRIEMEKPV